MEAKAARRREGSVPADGAFEWIETNGIPPRIWFAVAGFRGLSMFLVFFCLGILGSSNVVHSILFEPTMEVSGVESPPEVVATVWIFVIGFPAIMWGLIVGLVERSVGIGPSGVRVKKWVGTRTLPWESLRPQSLHPRGGWVFMLGTNAARPGSVGALMGPIPFYVSKDQARAILTHLSLPLERFPAPYWSWLGIV